jgi:hypothetical protein
MILHVKAQYGVGSQGLDHTYLPVEDKDDSEENLRSLAEDWAMSKWWSEKGYSLEWMIVPFITKKYSEQRIAELKTRITGIEKEISWIEASTK